METPFKYRGREQPTSRVDLAEPGGKREKMVGFSICAGLANVLANKHVQPDNPGILSPAITDKST